MPKKKAVKKKTVKKKLVEKPKKVEIKSIKQIETNNNEDIKSGLEHFIYGMLFGAVLMLIIMRILQII